MLISTEHSIAFLCMWKCGSTSIEHAINDYCSIRIAGSPKLKHLEAKCFNHTFLPMIKAAEPDLKIESFCLMRSPLEWVESWYRYRARRVLKNPDHPRHSFYTGEMSYEAFIEQFVLAEDEITNNYIETQHEFVCMEDGSIGVDYIFPLDRMDLVSEFLSEKIDKQITIPNLNVSRGRSAFLSKDFELAKSVESKLMDHLSKDILLYDFVKKNTFFDKKQHGDFIYS